MTRDEAESLLLAHLSRVERGLTVLVRRRGYTGDDADDAMGYVRMRLVEDDYALIRAFRGAASLPTYLSVVMAMLLRDYRARERGKWRPTAEAQRNGEVAVRLEAMVRRDSVPLRCAGEWLRASGLTSLGDRELAGLLARLPERAPLRPVIADDAALVEATASDAADRETLLAEAAARSALVRERLAQALERLAPADRTVLRLRYWEGLSVADIARALQREQKPLYRRIDTLLGSLESWLKAHGLSADDVRTLVETDHA